MWDMSIPNHQGGGVAPSIKPDGAAAPGTSAQQVPLPPSEPPGVPPGVPEPDPTPIQPPPDQEPPLPGDKPPTPIGDPPGEKPMRIALPPEVGGPKGPEPTRYGDWEQKGRVTDF